MMYLDLVLNLALLVALSVISGFIEKRRSRKTRYGALLQGFLFGSVAVIGMLRPLNLGPGLFFDGRSVMVSLCALFFGPWAAAIAVAMAIACRIGIGGVGTLTGVMVTLSTAGVGWLARRTLHPDLMPPDAKNLYFFGLAVHLVMIGMMFITLPLNTAWDVVQRIGPPVLLLYPLATVLAGKILSDQISAHHHLETLRQTRQYLDITLQSIGDAIIATTTAGEIRMMNAAAETLTGWSRDQAVGRSLTAVFHIIHAETRKPIENPVEKVLTKGAIVGLGNHTALIARDGTERQIADSAAPIMDESGRVIGVVLVFRDVTQRYRMQQALIQSEENYRKLFDDHAAVKLIIDPESGQIIHANHAAASYYGWSREALMRMKIQDINTASPQDVAIEMKKAESLNRIHFEFRHRLVDGSIRDVEVFSSRVLMREGEYLHSIIHDITDRKRAEARQQAGEKRMTAILQAVADPIVVYDINGCPLFINPAFTSLFGWTMEELQGKPIPFVPEDQKAATAEKIREMIASRSTVRMETRRLTKGGETIDMLVSASPIYNADGKSDGFVASLTDVTQIREMEKQIQQAQKMEAIGSLAGGIAHDFNNLLFPISGLTQMLMWDTPKDSSTYKDLNKIFDAVGRASELVKQILAFSRRAETNKSPVILQPIVKEVFHLTRSTIPANIDMVLQLEPQSIRVLADSTQMHQILMNLITNAYHAVERSGGSIHIELMEVLLEKNCPIRGTSLPAGKYALIRVSDTGQGIDPAILDRIFDPYFTTKPQGKGTGLGLSVVHGIVKASGGDIRVESRLDDGTVFYVYLPLLREGRMIRKKPDTAPLPAGSERILLIDDEVQIVDMATKLLQRQGYRVTGMTDSMAALADFIVDPSRYDLIVTDMAMPKLTGEALSKKILGIRPDIPIILCTGYSETIDEKAAKAIGIQGFFNKQGVTQALSGLIRNLLDRTQG